MGAGEGPFDVASLEGMKRKGLQALCKRFGIKANSKNVVLLAELRAHHAAALGAAEEVEEAVEVEVEVVQEAPVVVEEEEEVEVEEKQTAAKPARKRKRGRGSTKAASRKRTRDAAEAEEGEEEATGMSRQDSLRRVIKELKQVQASARTPKTTADARGDLRKSILGTPAAGTPTQLRGTPGRKTWAESPKLTDLRHMELGTSSAPTVPALVPAVDEAAAKAKSKPGQRKAAPAPKAARVATSAAKPAVKARKPGAAAGSKIPASKRKPKGASSIVDDIDDYLAKKQLRAKRLLMGCKPNSRLYSAKKAATPGPTEVAKGSSGKTAPRPVKRLQASSRSVLHDRNTSMPRIASASKSTAAKLKGRRPHPAPGSATGGRKGTLAATPKNVMSRRDNIPSVRKFDIKASMKRPPTWTMKTGPIPKVTA